MSLNLVLNCGGSTLKFKLLRMPEETAVASGMVDRLGSPHATFKYRRADGDALVTTESVSDHLEGLKIIFAALTHSTRGVLVKLTDLDAVAHKLAHGGERYHEGVRIDDEVIAILRELSPLAPLHNPPNLRGIEVVRELLPHVPQFGTFETGFHQTVPPYAWIYGLPLAWHQQHHVRKYGFHSASHRYVASRLTQPASRLISCHLGSGTSVCAIKDGHSVDISSGLTPQSGTMMSTRSGDFDPFVITHMMRRLGASPDEIDRILTRDSGLLGISGISGDLREVESAAQQGNDHAQLAMAAFCYRVRHYIGAFHAELGGLDALVFTGGIGENSPFIRAQVCAPLKHLGIELDPAANEVRGDDRVISAAGSAVSVRVIVTDEELMVARDANAALTLQGTQNNT